MLILYLHFFVYLRYVMMLIYIWIFISNLVLGSDETMSVSVDDMNDKIKIISG